MCANAILHNKIKHRTELTRPVAPEQISRASRTTTLLIPLASSSLAANTPVMPEPTTTTSARGGRDGVVRWFASGVGWVVCQKEQVGCGTGRVGMSE